MSLNTQSNPIQLHSVTSINNLYQFSDFNFSTFQFYYQSNKYYFIYDVLFTLINEESKILDITGYSGYLDDVISTEIYAQVPLFFQKRNRIKIPSKVEYVIKKYLPKKLLKNIHEDPDTAKELCLLLLAQLNSTYFEIKDGTKPEGWKHLKAEYLRELVSSDSMIYKEIINALGCPLKNGVVLEVDSNFSIGNYSRKYRLGAAYRGKGIVDYELKTSVAINAYNRYQLRLIQSANENPICKNLIQFYGDVTLPTLDQITKEAKRLIKKSYKTKKGRQLTFLNKHSRSYFANPDKLSFVEDSIEIFRYLTENGLMVPSVGAAESGCRVVDSFVLMPSWIRRLVKVSGRTHVEADYSCLHPNIAIALYGGNIEFLTHGKVAMDLGIETDVVKLEHLSFFNKTNFLMKQSPLWGYYQTNEPVMLNNIIRDKWQQGYKVTSRKLFAKEVEIMSKVIQQLNQESIYVGYVYDALFCHPKHTKRVYDVMNQVVLEHGVKTVAKVSSGRKHNPVAERLKESELDVTTIQLFSPGKLLALKPVNSTVEPERLLVDAGDVNFSHRLKADLLEKISTGQTLDFVDAFIVFGKDDQIRDKVLRVDVDYDSRKYVTRSYLMGA